MVPISIMDTSIHKTTTLSLKIVAKPMGHTQFEKEAFTQILYTQTIRKNHPPDPKSFYLDGTRLSLEPLQADGFGGLAR